MKKKICHRLSEIVSGISAEEFEMFMEIPPEEKMGDYALPCFALAKKMCKNPALIAEDIAEKLDSQKELLGIAKSENVGPYCNIFLNRASYVEKCLNTVLDENL